MNYKFRKHQIVKIKFLPNAEYIEYSPEHEGEEIKKGMLGKINIILSNGKYHVEIMNNGEIIAYAPFDEDQIEEASEEEPE